MSSPQFDPPGPNSHKGTTVIMVGLITLIVAASIFTFLSAVKL